MFYATVGLILTGLNAAHASIPFTEQGITSDAIGTQSDAFTVLNNWVGFLVGFLYFVWVVMILWAGFNVLTANGDEEKVKKWKSIIIQAVIGLVVVFIANSIVTWVITQLFGNAG